MVPADGERYVIYQLRLAGASAERARGPSL